MNGVSVAFAGKAVLGERLYRVNQPTGEGQEP